MSYWIAAPLAPCMKLFCSLSSSSSLLLLCLCLNFKLPRCAWAPPRHCSTLDFLDLLPGSPSHSLLGLASGSPCCLCTPSSALFWRTLVTWKGTYIYSLNTLTRHNVDGITLPLTTHAVTWNTFSVPFWRNLSLQQELHLTIYRYDIVWRIFF